jgi:hypothetical protein
MIPDYGEKNLGKKITQDCNLRQSKKLSDAVLKETQKYYKGFHMDSDYVCQEAPYIFNHSFYCQKPLFWDLYQ